MRLSQPETSEASGKREGHEENESRVTDGVASVQAGKWPVGKENKAERMDGPKVSVEMPRV